MSIDVKIVMVEMDPRGVHWRIGQEVSGQGGSVQRQLHLIPPRAFVEHAVEYGLSPADSRTILDWLLHARFAAHPDPVDLRRFCPYRNPPRVAWEAHQRLTAEIKSRVSITDPDGLLEQIHQAHEAHPVQIIQAMDRVEQTRAHVEHFEQNRRTHG